MRNIGRVLAACALTGTLACATSAEDPKPKAEGAKPAAAAGGSEVVAVVGDTQITMDEVDEKGRQIRLQTYVELHNVREQAFQTLLAEALLEKEAASQGVDSEALIEKEIGAKIQPVTEEEMKAFYDQNSAQMQGQPYDALKERIRQYLTNQKQVEARSNFIDALETKYQAKVSFEPMRMDVAVADEDPKKGPTSAPIQIVTFSEFQCPYCQRVTPTLDRVVDTYGDQVQIVFRDFPLPMHPQAHQAAQAAQCANAQGKFWQYHDKLFENQRALAPDNLKQYAQELGLDAGKFGTCLDSGEFQAEVDEDHVEGQRLGVTGTPAFFINGRFLNGAQPFEAFQQIIEDELDRKGVSSPVKS
jgi:protein-disulfide isomerase